MKDTTSHFKKAIQLFYLSKSLSNKQINQLQRLQKLRQPRTQETDAVTNRKNPKWTMALSMAASMAMVFVFIGLLSTPHIVTHAYSDVLKDATDFVQQHAQITDWLQSNNIKRVPTKYPLEMSKYCYLDKNKTVHLRIAGIERGKLHLFFHQGKDKTNWLNRAGTHGDMNWKLLQLKKDLTLLAMYTQDMRESSVNHIVNEMISTTG